MFADKQARDEFFSEYSLFFTTKIVDLYKRKIEPSTTNVLNLLKSLKIINTPNLELEESMIAMLSARAAHSLSPIVESIKYFSAENKKTLVQYLIASFKNKSADIRQLNYNELFMMITEVLNHEEKDASHFFKYLEKLLQSNTDYPFDINTVSDLFYAAVQYGYVGKKEISQFNYHYLNKL